MKKIIFVFLFGWMVFGFLTFASLLLFWDWNNRLNFRLGFPLRFYEQFHLRGNAYANHGGNVVNLLLDVAFAWIAGLFLLRSIKKHY